ncbi:hypothetical protein [Microbacterium ulmi]|uniref:Uncharacterized protein n=1 Tax=Microbacterium ulmi TaxID=179095 RepID=A0A7Y2LYF1_9MICO|nr:hypothetical protein [Microbacterium ulmi]NII71132.1 hypothetical protein [Microbacterium ulmi]NNH02439.1 hypothetical protein [Microbacterium ulmi]
MALVHATRITSQPTPAERVALAIAVRIADVVAWRIQRRADRVAGAVPARTTVQDAAAARDAHRAEAHWLGLR